jgi:hypothetical protein
MEDAVRPEKPNANGTHLRVADVDVSVLERLQATVINDPLNPIFAEALRCEAIKVIRAMQFALAEYANKRYEYVLEKHGEKIANDLYHDRQEHWEAARHEPEPREQ